MSEKVYKAVWTCPKYNEREVWYVSSRHKAMKMVNGHICGHKKRLKKYKGMEMGVDMHLEVRPIFNTLPDVGIIDTSSFTE